MNSDEDNLTKHTIEIDGASFSGLNVPLNSALIKEAITSRIVMRGREKYGNDLVGVIVRKYYAAIMLIEQERKNGNLETMKGLCEESLEMIEALIIDSKELYGTFNLTKIPAIERLFKTQSFCEDKDKIQELKELIEEFPELQIWKDKLAKIQSKQKTE
jgi:hypothetical protein